METATRQGIHNPTIVGWQTTNHTIKMHNVNDVALFQKLNFGASVQLCAITSPVDSFGRSLVQTLNFYDERRRRRGGSAFLPDSNWLV
jgi:hypothetical protein